MAAWQDLSNQSCSKLCELDFAVLAFGILNSNASPPSSCVPWKTESGIGLTVASDQGGYLCSGRPQGCKGAVKSTNSGVS